MWFRRSKSGPNVLTWVLCDSLGPKWVPKVANLWVQKNSTKIFSRNAYKRVTVGERNV